jgi:alkyl hydroperoxide reductase subunit AhpC
MVVALDPPVVLDVEPTSVPAPPVKTGSNNPFPPLEPPQDPAKASPMPTTAATRYHAMVAQCLSGAARRKPITSPVRVASRQNLDKTWPSTANRAHREDPMTLRIGDTAPDFEADTTSGHIKFHEWLGDSWGVLFSHPKDFTPVCTTELGYMAKLKPEFDKRNVKIIGLSVDPVDAHSKWSNDIKETQGHAPNYPMIGDPELKVAKAWGMLPAELAGSSQGRTAADNQTVRNVFVVGPDKKIKLILVYPMTTGRNFDEVLRVIDSLQLTAKHKVATPVNWKHGDDVIIAGSVSDDDAKKQYPNGWKAPKPYIRIVPQPK